MRTKMIGLGLGLLAAALMLTLEVGWQAPDGQADGIKMPVVKLGQAQAGKRRDKASAKHKANCLKWCKGNKKCTKCSRKPACGSGYSPMKSWTGFGDNWYACSQNKRGQAGDKHATACQDWCRKHRRCTKCSKKTGCGRGFKTIKRWTGYGQNWHACEHTGSINIIWPGNSAAKARHRVLLVAAGGSGASTSDDGIEWFCDDYFKGKHPGVLCISAWGNISTHSRTLSNNIANLANAIKKKSGQRPKIILVGKSMGGCKLHHAATGAKTAKSGKLKKMTVDLFVGIDMSCHVDRHFEEGKKQALYFTKNVKELVVFYQEKRNEAQTGSRGIYKGKKFNRDIHTNVNKNDFDLRRERRSTSMPQKGICKNVGHKQIDDCKALKDIVYKLVKKRIPK